MGWKVLQKKIGQNFEEKIGQNCEEKIGQIFEKQIGKNFQEKLGQNFEVKIGQNFEEKIGQNCEEIIGQNFEEKICDMKFIYFCFRNLPRGSPSSPTVSRLSSSQPHLNLLEKRDNNVRSKSAAQGTNLNNFFCGNLK